MEEIIVRACGFLFVIILGYVLKRIGVFRASDKEFLSTLIMKVTLPMALAANFRTLELDISYLVAFIFGLLSNLLIMTAILFIYRKKPPVKCAFLLINCAGYNLGLCAIPFLQSFFTPEALAVVCLFDVGNAIMIFGVLVAVFTKITQEEDTYSIKDSVNILLRSVLFMTYMIMITLMLLHISLPSAVYDTLDLVAAANPFLAMLLIGILFEPKLKTDALGDMGRVILIRLVANCIFIFITFKFLPISIVFKQALCVVFASPIVSIAPIYTKQCGGDDVAAAVLNSFMLPVSMILMTIMVGIFHAA